MAKTRLILLLLAATAFCKVAVADKPSWSSSTSVATSVTTSVTTTSDQDLVNLALQIEGASNTNPLPADDGSDEDSVLFLLNPSSTNPSCGPLKSLRPFTSRNKVKIVKASAKFLRASSRRRSLQEMTTEQLADDVKNECARDVLAAAPNYKVQTNSRPMRSLKAAAVVNDPYFPNEWGMTNINAPDAWKAGFKGSISAPVCVIDTGVQITHPELLKQLKRNLLEKSDSTDNDGNGFVDDLLCARALTVNGVVYRDGLCGDDNGHGTHVSGIIAAIANNTAGVAGVAPGTQILVCKALDKTGAGYLSDLTACVDWCASRGARIINNSWGSCLISDYWTQFMSNLYASYSNILFVFAAGNANQNTDLFPSCGFPGVIPAPNVINVGGSTPSGTRDPQSNYGVLSVEVGAPDVNIISTFTGTTYQIYQGTSMAAAHVSGAAALILGARPDLTPAQVRTALMNTCTKPSLLQSLLPWNGCGGIINAYAAVKLAQTF